MNSEKSFKEYPAFEEFETSSFEDEKVIYDLEERTFQFAKRVRALLKLLPKNISNIEDSAQLTRSSGSVGANYIEVNEAISAKDFLYRLKICRKESKESRYWLRLLDTGENIPAETERSKLVNEAHELVLIFNSIIRKNEVKIK
jgi:four helix bundle protein